MKWGLTELNPQEFKRAIKSLNIAWADDQYQLDLVFDSLDRDDDKQMRGTLTLDEIAVGILDCVSGTISSISESIFEMTFSLLKKN